MKQVESLELDASAFANALLSGIYRVASHQEALNRINVFPVADGDTGTNLALTLLAARAPLTHIDHGSLGQLLEQVADALLEGARGNSGAIMAQFFQGMADATQTLQSLSVQNLAQALQTAAAYSREALSEPREGTILSVISAFANSVEGLGSEVSRFPDVFTKALAVTQAALERTPEQLSVLKKAGVVDAGAQGFVHLLEGMRNYFHGGDVPDFSDYVGIAPDSAIETAGNEEDLEYRFCTECIVTGEAIDRRRLRQTLSELGGSLVLAGSRNKAKIHIHVNDPADVFTKAARFGTVSSEKADDMQRQQSTTHSIKGGVAVITDSAADIPEEAIERLNIHVVPLRVHFGTRGYMDKLSISATEFFAELASNPAHPQTSQPAPGDFRRQYQFLASHFPHVIAPTLTGTVSGTLNAARSAAVRSGKDRVHVIDTLNASTGQGLLVMQAAELAQAGHSVDEIRAELTNSIPLTQTFALLKDLGAAVRGGRVPAYAYWLAKLLRLNPVLGTTALGEVKPISALIGRGNRIVKFARFVSRRASPGARYRVNIAHGCAADDAQQLAALLSAKLNLVGPATLCELGAAIGVHGGPGTLVVSIQQDMRAAKPDPGSQDR